MECAELEIGLYAAKEGCFTLDFRFWQPGSSAFMTLGPATSQPFSIDQSGLLGPIVDVKAYGERIREAIFSANGSKEAFAQARLLSSALSMPLRVRLFLHPALPPELHALRWEALADPNGGPLPLAMSENLLLSRFLSSDNAQPFAPQQRDQLRALIVVSSPENLSMSFEPLDREAELRRARSGMKGMHLVELGESRGQATLENLLDGLRSDIDVLYLVAHGGMHKGLNKPFVLLEKADGKAHPVFTEELVSRLGDLPLLAVLVACQSAGSDENPLENPMLALGPALAQRGVPAVVAMQGSVTFPTMEEFLPSFFKELQRDGQIDRAVAAARARLGERPDWWMPVLYSRLRDNCILLPAQGAQPLEVEWFEPETVFVPAGKFWMGREPGPAVPVWETPVHEVDLPAYRIGKFPVTNQQFGEFIAESSQAVSPETGWLGQNPPADTLNFPVAGVTWFQAMEYCRWLSAKTGREYMLPNEAQWEKAARGEQGWYYPWGNEWRENLCNALPGVITAVDAFPPQGPYGCYDLIGNIREWTLSLWGERRSEPDPRYRYPWTDNGRNDPNANSLVRRIFRGGSAENPPEMTCTARYAFAPDKSGLPGKRHGFRVVMKV